MLTIKKLREFLDRHADELTDDTPVVASDGYAVYPESDAFIGNGKDEVMVVITNTDMPEFPDDPD